MTNPVNEYLSKLSKSVYDTFTMSCGCCGMSYGFAVNEIGDALCSHYPHCFCVCQIGPASCPTCERNKNRWDLCQPCEGKGFIIKSKMKYDNKFIADCKELAKKYGLQDHNDINYLKISDLNKNDVKGKILLRKIKNGDFKMIEKINKIPCDKCNKTHGIVPAKPGYVPEKVCEKHTHYEFYCFNHQKFINSFMNGLPLMSQTTKYKQYIRNIVQRKKWGLWTESKKIY